MAAVVQVKFVVSDQEGLAKLANWKNQVAALGSGSGSAAPFAITGKGFSDFGREAERSSRLTDVFRQSIHTLHPVLESAGVSMGAFGALARVAGGGLIALAVAASGAALVAIAKVGEQAKKTKEEIDALYGPGAAPGAGGPGAPPGTGKRLGEGAASVGTTRAGLVGTVGLIRDTAGLEGEQTEEQAQEQYEHSFRDPGIIHDRGQRTTLEEAEKQAKAFSALLQTKGGQTPDEAQKSSDKFFGALKEQALAKPDVQPRVTAEMVEDLPRGVANEIAHHFGERDKAGLQRGILRGRILDRQSIQDLLDDQGPTYESELAARPPERRTVSGEAQALINREKDRLAPMGAAIDTAGVKVSDFLKDASQLPPGRHPLPSQGLGLLSLPAAGLNTLFPNLGGAAGGILRGLLPSSGTSGGLAPGPLPWVQQMMERAQPQSSSGAAPQQHVIDIRINGESVGQLADDDATLSRVVSAAVNAKLNEIVPRQSAAQ